MPSSVARARSISVIENGNNVSITEDKNGIIVSVNGKRVRAKDVAELKNKFPDTFKLYEKHTRAATGHNGKSDATTLLREELGKLRDANADNPQLKDLIEEMLRQ